MFVRKHVLMDGENGGEGTGAGGGGGSGIDMDNPAIKEAIQSAVDLSTKSIKENLDSIIKEKRDLQRQLKSFEGIDVDKIKDMQSRFENDEEAKLISEGKIDEVINRRTERMRTDLTTKLDAASETEAKITAERDSFKDMFHQERINNQIRLAAEKSGVLPEAIEDIIKRAAGVFSLNDDGAIVARDKEGNLILSKDGKSVLGPPEFVETLKESASYYWPGSVGGGAGGSGAGKGSADLNTQMQAAVARGDMKEYRRLRAELKKVG